MTERDKVRMNGDCERVSVTFGPVWCVDMWKYVSVCLHICRTSEFIKAFRSLLAERR